MGKRHITARIEEGTAAALDLWAAEHGTGRSEAIERLIKAGLEAGRGEQGADRERADQSPIAGETGPSGASQEATASRTVGDVRDGYPEALQGVIEALKASNADLRAALIDTRSTVATLVSQLEVKDRQIEAAHGLADHAQRLQAAEVARLLPEESQHMTIFERIKTAVRGQR